MNLRHNLLLSVLLILVFAKAQGQQALLSSGDKSYAELSYIEAIEAYEQAFRKNASSIPHARRLADCYWTLRDTKNAERWYAIVAASSQAEPEDVYRYAELLRITGQFAASDLWMKRYAKLAPNDSRVELKENATERLGEIMGSDGITHKVVRAEMNTEFSEICPFIHGDTIIFASSRVHQFGSRDVHSLNNQPFLDLFQGVLGRDGKVSQIKALDGTINTKYHESNLVIATDGSELYFTRNNYHDGRKVLGEDGVNNLEIYMRERTAQGWGKEVPFPYNSPAYSVGHPSLTYDQSRLYFTSNMPGGLGGKDLYVCYRDVNGSWGEPQNLGAPINTEGDEMFPYVFQNTLYFASDGQLGLGGLDIFRCTIRGKGYGVVQNLSAPVNSTADDFGICLDANGHHGFFTSDRDAVGDENIYQFVMNSKGADERKWSGRVLDAVDARAIPHLTVRLLDMDRNEIARTVTGPNGEFEFPAPNVPASISARIPGGAGAVLAANEFEISSFGNTDLPDMYINSVMDLPVNAILRDAMTDEWLDGVAVTVKDARDGTLLFHGITDDQGITQGEIPDRRFGEEMNLQVSFQKSGYLTKTINVDTRILMFLEHALTGPEGAGLSPISAGIDMAEAMNLRPIYFDFRDHRIRSDAAGELDLVAQVLRLDPSISIELRSHTDSRASIEYNDALSERRAQSSRQYLVAQGIAADRIIAKGFGERQLVNHCNDNAECSEEEHQMNRRTEFIITGCKDCGLVGQQLKL
jgi:outer membrane protein OmpA-like peptidoglycan-associated protein